MAADRSTPTASRRGAVPADLVAIVVATALLNVVLFGPVVRETMLRIVLVLPFVLFVPGYVLVAALFPERGAWSTSGEFDTDDDARSDVRLDQGGIDGAERITLSFGLSAVVVPVVGLLLILTPWGIRLLPVAISITTFTLFVTVVAAFRRWNVPEEERFRVPYRTWLDSGYAAVFRPDDRADAALTLLLVASVLLAAGSAGYALTVLPQDDEFSSVQMLAEDDDGELVADEYPTELEVGDTGEVVLEIENQEDRSVTYDVVLVEQNVETDDDDVVLQDEQELDHLEVQLDDGERWTDEYELEPTSTGEVRLIWLVYLGDVPDDPSTENADHYVHLWLEVTDDDDDVATIGSDEEATIAEHSIGFGVV